MKSWKAIIFDLDDTLYPELAFVKSGFRHVAAACGERFDLDPTQVYAEFFQLHQSGKRGKIFDAWLETHGLPMEPHRDWMVTAYRLHDPTIALHPGVPQLLSQLRDAGLALGVISDGPWRMQRKKFAALELAAYFAQVQFTDELGRDRWKPHPAAFEIVLARLKARAEQAVYVGDNPQKDFIGARQLGLGTIRVRYPGGVYTESEPPTDQHGPDAEIPSLTHLPAVLRNFSRRIVNVPPLKT